ncbi:Prosaposin [Bagarius yarrelli]|uniref:Small ribosomal subunit protein bS6m n=1 Tax=Bagarius yarrelli TaxID=175774 RepID=A0A556U7X7_BAGYA|nr:Prosaposin [Bagarius yarrelli]
MPRYELALVLKAMQRPETAATLKRTVETLMERGAVVRNLENLGERRLPYKIRKHNQRHTHAGFFLIDFHASPSIMTYLLNHLERDVDVVRQTVLKKETEPPKAPSRAGVTIPQCSHNGEPNKSNLRPRIAPKKNQLDSEVMMLLTLLLVTTAVASPLLGTEQCAHGPPYWCQNAKTASLCGAVSHCQQNVWNQPHMKSVPCELCKEVVTVVGQLLKDNSTEAEVLSYLEKTCQLVPDESLSSQCKEIVDNYFPVIIDIIKGELDDPGVVCSALGLCVSQQAALAKAQLMSNEIPEMDLTQRVSPFLLNIPQLLYPKESANGQKETTSKEGTEVCDDCIKFITDTQEAAKKNATFVSSMIEQIESQCDLLGPGISDICKQYVSQYAPLVFQQLMSMQPKDICCRAGFCDSTPESVPMLNLVPAKSISAVKTFPATKLVKPLSVKPAKKLVRARDSPQCAICEFVMKELESMIQDQTTEDEVVQAVEKVCSILPSTLSAQCKDLIETYGQAIIELLIQEADPKTVCSLLGLCKEASRAFIPVMEKAEFQAGGFCEVCKMAVRYVDGILEKNATEAQIEDAVKKVCNFLPDEYKTQCDQLIDQYEPLLSTLLHASSPVCLMAYGHVFLLNRVEVEPTDVLVDQWPDFRVLLVKSRQQQHEELFKAVAVNKGVPMTKSSVAYLMEMKDPSKVTTERLSVQVSPIQESHAALINNTWKFGNGEVTEPLIRSMIRMLPSYCVLDTEGRPVSWVLTHVSSEIGVMYTLPEHRGKGFAKAVTTTLVKKLHLEGYPVYCFVEELNLPPYRLLTSLGFIKAPSYKNALFHFNCL